MWAIYLHGCKDFMHPIKLTRGFGCSPLSLTMTIFLCHSESPDSLLYLPFYLTRATPTSQLALFLTSQSPTVLKVVFLTQWLSIVETHLSILRFWIIFRSDHSSVSWVWILMLNFECFMRVVFLVFVIYCFGIWRCFFLPFLCFALFFGCFSRWPKYEHGTDKVLWFKLFWSVSVLIHAMCL